MMPIKRYPIIYANISECYVSIFNGLIYGIDFEYRTILGM